MCQEQDSVVSPQDLVRERSSDTQDSVVGTEQVAGRTAALLTTCKYILHFTIFKQEGHNKHASN